MDFGSNEILNIDGSDVALKSGNSVTTKANSMPVNVKRNRFNGDGNHIKFLRHINGSGADPCRRDYV